MSLSEDKLVIVLIFFAGEFPHEKDTNTYGDIGFNKNGHLCFYRFISTDNPKIKRIQVIDLTDGCKEINDDSFPCQINISNTDCRICIHDKKLYTVQVESKSQKSYAVLILLQIKMLIKGFLQYYVKAVIFASILK